MGALREFLSTTHPYPQPLGLFQLAARSLAVVKYSPMPLHAYAPLVPPCRLCGDGFEHRASAGAPDLAACPTCGQPVQRRAAQPVNFPKLSAPLSVSRARQAGFTVLKRTPAGEFEKQ